MTRTKGKERVETQAGSIIPCVCPVILKYLRGKKMCFKEERNRGKVGQDRRTSGREFQMDGAANENERRPLADRISGIVRRSLSRDLKFLVGV